MQGAEEINLTLYGVTEPGDVFDLLKEFNNNRIIDRTLCFIDCESRLPSGKCG